MAGSGEAVRRMAAGAWRRRRRGKLWAARVLGEGGGCDLGEKLGHGGALNRAAGAPRRAGPGSVRHVSAPDSGASPSWTRAGGRGRP
jgi:hypothetical protein